MLFLAFGFDFQGDEHNHPDIYSYLLKMILDYSDLVDENHSWFFQKFKGWFVLSALLEYNAGNTLTIRNKVKRIIIYNQADILILIHFYFLEQQNHFELCSNPSAGFEIEHHILTTRLVLILWKLNILEISIDLYKSFHTLLRKKYTSFYLVDRKPCFSYWKGPSENLIDFL